MFIIHGTKDEVVPYWHGDELLRSVPSEYRAQPFWVEGLGHNNIENKVRDEYFRRIQNFLKKHVAVAKKSIPEECNAARSKFTASPVPVHERYKPMSSLRESGKFVFNQTWVKHGTEIVNSALQSKGFNNGLNYSTTATNNNKSHHPDLKSIGPPSSFTEPIEFGRTRTSSLLSKVRAERQDKYKWSGDDCSVSNASRFIETLESWANTSTELDDFDTENITLISRTESMSADPGLSFDNPYIWSASTMSESEHVELKSKSLDGY